MIILVQIYLVLCRFKFNKPASSLINKTSGSSKTIIRAIIDYKKLVVNSVQYDYSYFFLHLNIPVT